MRWLPALRISSALLFVTSIALGIATIRCMNDTRRWVSAMSNSLMSCSLADRALQLDLLNARVGLLRNYDPVNADLASERESLADLGRLPMRRDARLLLGHLTEKTEERERLVERFKSGNALLQNSLTRFTANGSAEVGLRNVLSARILKLTLDTSPQTVREAREALAQMPKAEDGSPAAQLGSHARLLVNILPEIDGLLQAIRGAQMEDRIGRLQVVVVQESRDRAAVLLQMQCALLANVLLLTVSVVALVFVQRLRTRELKAQAANERLSAAIATPLIDTENATFALRVRDAAERLAQHIGAKRLQLMIPRVPTLAAVSWPDGSGDPQWLRKFSDAADVDGAWSDDRVIASSRGDAISPRLNEAMREGGVSDLVLLRTAEPFRVVIGFEPEELAFAERRDRMAGLASAIVAIAHGARREAMQFERDRLERSLARARRMETIGTMASGVAHNFNNIIGAIGGFAEMGQERTRAGSSARYSFDEIRDAVERSRALVDDILNFAKSGRSPKVPLDLGRVLAQAVRLLGAGARDDEVFQLQAAPAPYWVLGSERDLQQVFLNIGNNAWHAGDRRAVLIATQHACLTEPTELSHGSVDPGCYVIITITDSGPGIADTARHRLFEPFFTTKGGGTGLGLSTAWEIVQDHGGMIAAENLDDGGAQISVWLPMLAGAGGPSPSGNGARILLVTEPARLADEEERLAEFGYEPIGFTVFADAGELRAMIKECDAILFAGVRSPQADALMRDISPYLETRPLLLAWPESDMPAAPMPARRLDYPIDPQELFDLLDNCHPGYALASRL